MVASKPWSLAKWFFCFFRWLDCSVLWLKIINKINQALWYKLNVREQNTNKGGISHWPCWSWKLNFDFFVNLDLRVINECWQKPLTLLAVEDHSVLLYINIIKMDRNKNKMDLKQKTSILFRKHNLEISFHNRFCNIENRMAQTTGWRGSRSQQNQSSPDRILRVEKIIEAVWSNQSQSSCCKGPSWTVVSAWVLLCPVETPDRSLRLI